MGLFGTNGIRGVLNETLDPDMAFKLGMSVSTYYDTQSVAVGYDSRTSNELLEGMVAAGVMNSGKNVIRLGLIPIPAIQVYCKLKGIAGIMITASHNPPEFNGLKVIEPNGSHPSKDGEAKLEDIILKEHYLRTTWDFVGKSLTDSGSGLYVGEILKNVHQNAIRGKRFKVAADCANSSTLMTTPLLLKELGVHYTTLNANPDGFFPGRNPEPTEENLKQLVILAKSGEFDLSVAHDGDGDRAVYLDENGDFVDGDKVVALIADHILENTKGKIVVPISSSFLIDRIAEKHKVEVVRTKVGAPIVSETLEKIGGVFGGEENGGVIYPKHLNARDGAFSLAILLDIMAKKGESLSQMVKELPNFKIKRLRLPMTNEFDSFARKLQENYPGFKEERLDGIRLIDHESFILARKSGTEPIIRIYISSTDDEWINSREREITKFLGEK